MANRLRLERRGLISAVCDIVSDESVDKLILILFSLLQGGQKVMIQYGGWKMILVFVWLGSCITGSSGILSIPSHPS
jgi:hypothetical protein